MTRIIAPTLLALGLAGCASLNTATSTAAAAQPALTTLATLAAQNSTTVSNLIARGQLFCKSKVSGVTSAIAIAAPIVGAAGALVPGAGAAIGVGASVLGAAANDVAQACAAINALPVPAPTDVPTQSVPVVAVPVPSTSTVKPVS